MKIRFTKMQASGNDFIVLEDGPHLRRKEVLSKKLCDRKFGIGADGVLFLSRKSAIADFRLTIYNSDGSRPKMCGNGSRCAALFFQNKLKIGNRKLKIETDAGVIGAKVTGKKIRIKMQDASSFRNIKLKVLGKNMTVHYVVLGVPHAVLFVSKTEDVDVFSLGRTIRYHREFRPAGANVDFVRVLNRGEISIRTYERGVEGETLSCGTGAVSSVFIANKLNYTGKSVTVIPASGEKLKIDIEKDGNYLEGFAEKVFTGVIDL
ncbi:MAG: diaminopimelate epimerase [Elusimicrobia bacterium CG08_land_8_20_14_0_20_44_26]|nr:MAG: diaminopimelate epimerase [Elusimicrobia bacterium CG08_land_8_20_14_0_20_44_26]